MALIRKVNGRDEVIADKSITQHNELGGREQYGAHPISAIRGLPEKLHKLKVVDEDLQSQITQNDVEIDTIKSNIDDLTASLTSSIEAEITAVDDKVTNVIAGTLQIDLDEEINKDDNDLVTSNKLIFTDVGFDTEIGYVAVELVKFDTNYTYYTFDGTNYNEVDVGTATFDENETYYIQKEIVTYSNSSEDFYLAHADEDTLHLVIDSNGDKSFELQKVHTRSNDDIKEDTELEIIGVGTAESPLELKERVDNETIKIDKNVSQIYSSAIRDNLDDNDLITPTRVRNIEALNDVQNDRLTTLETITHGTGGYLNSNDFGELDSSAETTQTTLIEYAIQDLGIDINEYEEVDISEFAEDTTYYTYDGFKYSEASEYDDSETYYITNGELTTDETAAKIHNGARVINLNDNHVWIYNYVSATYDDSGELVSEASYSWTDLGEQAVASDATNDGIHGLVTGSYTDFEGSIDSLGHITINNLTETLDDLQSQITENKDYSTDTYVTLASEQEITGQKTFTQSILTKSGLTVNDEYILSSSNNTLTLSTVNTSSGNNSSAIGYNAVVNADNSIQLGNGTNSNANTLQVNSYKVLDLTTGYIDNNRIDSDIARTQDMIDADNERLKYLGEYNANTTYSLNDVVYYNNNFYVCEEEGIVGQAPDNSEYATTEWRRLGYRAKEVQYEEINASDLTSTDGITAKIITAINNEDAFVVVPGLEYDYTEGALYDTRGKLATNQYVADLETQVNNDSVYVDTNTIVRDESTHNITAIALQLNDGNYITADELLAASTIIVYEENEEVVA